VPPGAPVGEGTRAYRAAVAAHNARVDEYNALVAEMHSRDAWGDDAAAVELRRRLDLAREAVDRARRQVGRLRPGMEREQGRAR
jgi:hypothetical protein